MAPVDLLRALEIPRDGASLGKSGCSSHALGLKSSPDPQRIPAHLTMPLHQDWCLLPLRMLSHVVLGGAPV